MTRLSGTLDIASLGDGSVEGLRFFPHQSMQRADGSGVWWMCSIGSLSDHPEEAGALPEKEPQWLLGRLGKSEFLQVTFANESEMESRNRRC